MVSKGQPKSSKPPFPRHAIQAHKPVLFIGEGAKMNCSFSAFGSPLWFLTHLKVRSVKKKKQNGLPDFSFDTP